MQIVTVLVILFGVSDIDTSETRQQELRQQFPLLGSLYFKAAELPKGCAIVKDAGSAIGLKGNRFITEKPIFFEMVEHLLGRKFDDDVWSGLRSKVRAEFVSAYEENDELGVVGWTFKTTKAAKKLKYLLEKSHDNKWRLILCDRTVVFFWFDKGVTSRCIRQFAQLIEKRIREAQSRQNQKSRGPIKTRRLKRLGSTCRGLPRTTLFVDLPS